MSKSSQEMRQLVESLHPRSPKEVMGEAASSSLLSSTITAALSTLGLLLGFTVIVFLIGGAPEKKTEAAAATTPAVTTDTKPATDVATEQPADPAATATGKSDDGKTDTADAVDKMGIGDAKDADSKPETLENKLDDLLKGLE